jgi:CheY-like chemotaxis protein
MNRHIILWLEDVPETVSDYITRCEDWGVKVKIIATSHVLVDFLKKFHEQVCLVIVDIMLLGVKDLDDAEVPGVDTEDGYSAGWEIIEHIFRPGKKEALYAEIPLVILTSRIFTEDDHARLDSLNSQARARGLREIEYYLKFGVDDTSKYWEKEFEGLIKNSCRGNVGGK